MRLALALVALALTPSTALADDGTVAWGDPCGDDGSFAVVADQRTAVPDRSGDATDLRGAEVAVRDGRVVVTLDACGPVGTGEGTLHGVGFTAADGCSFAVARFTQVDLRDAEDPSAAPAGVLSRDCGEDDGVPLLHDAADTVRLPAGAVRHAGPRLTITVDRAALPSRFAGAFAAGASWSQPGAYAAEQLAVVSPALVTLGSRTVLGGQVGAIDVARGPAALTLG